MVCELSVQVLQMVAFTGTERLPEVDNCPVFWLVQYLQFISSNRFAIGLPAFECMTAKVCVLCEVGG